MDPFQPFVDPLPPAPEQLPTAAAIKKSFAGVTGTSTSNIGAAASELCEIGLALAALSVAERKEEEDELAERLMECGLCDVLPKLLKASDLSRQAAGIALCQAVRQSTPKGQARGYTLGNTPGLVEGLADILVRHGLGTSSPRRQSVASLASNTARGDNPKSWGQMGVAKAEFVFLAAVSLSKIASRCRDCHPRLLAENGPVSMALKIVKEARLPVAICAYMANFLYNITRNPASRSALLRAGVIEPLLVVARAGSPAQRSFAAAMAVANLASGAEENKALAEATPDVLRQVLEAMEATLKNERYCGSTWRLTELLMGMASLASNDVNKQRLSDSGAIEVVMRALKTLDPLSEPVDSSTKNFQCWDFGTAVLYNLAFDEKVLRKMQHMSDVCDLLKQLQSGPAGGPRNNAAGITFLFDEADGTSGKKPRKSLAPGSQGHIMISYNWNEQDTVVRISDELKAKGYKVWLDLDMMQGSTLEAMAGAVEGASVVCVCLSESYKNSPNCRLEAEYAFSQRVAIVPILVQDGYRATGWLGALTGSKLWYDCSSRLKLSSSLRNLERELKTSATADPAASSAGPTHNSSKKNNDVQSWDVAAVGKWLADSQFNASVIRSFAKNGITGRALAGMMSERASPLDVILRKDVGISSTGVRFEVVAALTDLFR